MLPSHPPHPALSHFSHSIPPSAPAPPLTNNAQTPFRHLTILSFIERYFLIPPPSSIPPPKSPPHRSSALQAHRPTSKVELNRGAHGGETRSGSSACAAWREIKDRVFNHGSRWEAAYPDVKREYRGCGAWGLGCWGGYKLCGGGFGYDTCDALRFSIMGEGREVQTWSVEVGRLSKGGPRGGVELRSWIQGCGACGGCSEDVKVVEVMDRLRCSLQTRRRMCPGSSCSRLTRESVCDNARGRLQGGSWLF